MVPILSKLLILGNGGENDQSFEPIKPTIWIMGNGAEVKRIEYIAPMPGLTDEAISETIKF
ncbi:hypothetical protein [Anditalea andensis]|uniref:Uncharacterized protein n=1 Tax=Anditalea andensis TaxID=1048983 RepID=A0A074KXX4_9BACT|nr:hypothetical protein [Anditalea andensis]KEO73055.1 hypothetical protein EL17_15705 [Anditalea andensis]